MKCSIPAAQREQMQKMIQNGELEAIPKAGSAQ
jgi:hypothetical protein